MKKTFCALSLVFGVLCLICGACYGGLLAWELIKKFRETKDSAIQKIRLFVNNEE